MKIAIRVYSGRENPERDLTEAEVARIDELIYLEDTAGLLDYLKTIFAPTWQARVASFEESK